MWEFDASVVEAEGIHGYADLTCPHCDYTARVKLSGWIWRHERESRRSDAED